MNNTFTNRPVTMNENKNLLEIEEHMYILDDVKKPNVFRNMFPYSEIPKIPFNDRTVPHDMPKDIWITDTTFRDGQQSRAPYSTEQIVTIYDYLHRLGGENGLIRASEFFLYSKKDRDLNGGSGSQRGSSTFVGKGAASDKRTGTGTVAIPCAGSGRKLGDAGLGNASCRQSVKGIIFLFQKD